MATPNYQVEIATLAFVIPFLIGEITYCVLEVKCRVTKSTASMMRPIIDFQEMRLNVRGARTSGDSDRGVV